MVRSFTRGLRLRPVLLSALSLIALFGSLAPLRASAAVQTFNVTTYGAVGDGVTDSTQAIRNTIAAAEAAGPGSIVFLPAGHFISNLADTNPQALWVTGTVPIVINGAGSGLTEVSEMQGKKDLLSIKTDGTVVSNLTLDTQTSDARAPLTVSASNTVVKHDVLLGGTNTFALFYPGPPGATKTNGLVDTGNKVLNLTINDRWNRDGFSFAYQNNGLIENIDHTGSRLALFVVYNLKIKNYTYHPGTQPGGTNGWYITPPATNVAITNFVTDGEGGVIGSDTLGYVSKNITVTNEVFRQNGGFHLSVGDAQGVTIDGCNFGTNNSLRLIPSVAASGVVVKNCTSLPIVRFVQPHGASVSAEFDNNTYPAFTPPVGVTPQTFQNTFSGPSNFVVNGGTFQNCSGGFWKGSNTYFMVSGLSGYPCSADSPPTAALVVTPNSGSTPLHVSADASGSTDPDSTPISNYRFNFGDGTLVGPQTSATASHIYTTPGAFTVTVTVVDTAGLAGTTTKPVTAISHANLVGNPGFETDLSGWAAGSSTTLTRSATAHSGSFSAQLTRVGSTGKANLDDNPDWNANTLAGSTCTSSAWVLAPAGIVVKVVTTEYQGTAKVATVSAAVTGIGGTWQHVSVAQVIANNSDSVELIVSGQRLNAGQTVLVDDVSEAC